MQITMLGYRGCGKTCYMLGMYSFMSMGLNGFTISATDLDVDLDLINKWDQLVEEQGESRWPTGTDENVYEYVFNFNYAAKPIMEFNWIDYRGGALRDKSSATDVAKLMDYVKDSNCLFLCISGEYLTEEIVSENGDLNQQAKSRVGNKLKIQPINKILVDIQQKFEPSNEKPFPIVIVVTKYDKCSHRGKDAVIRDVKGLFELLFQPDSGWLTAICPVSLGKDLANDINGGEINPVNIHLPVAFAVYSKLMENAKDEKAKKYSLASSLSQEKQGNWFQKWINSENIDQKEKSIQQLEGQLETLTQKMNLLVKELGKIPLYLGDQELELNDKL
jgi:hypothetical protein